MPRVHTSTVVLTDVTLYRLEWGLVLDLAPGGYGAQNNILTCLTKGWKLRCLVQLGEPLHKGSRARCEQRASSLDCGDLECACPHQGRGEKRVPAWENECRSHM